jgi:hypothetical protein
VNLPVVGNGLVLHCCEPVQITIGCLLMLLYATTVAVFEA